MVNNRNKAISKYHQIPNGNLGLVNPVRSPFWLPATSYYFLTVAIAFVVFFILWWFFNEAGDETPWIPAGIFASSLLIGSVILREIFLRKARNNYLQAKDNLIII